MKESQFTRGLLGLIGINLLQYLLIFITLGFGAPWAICMKERWIAKHTIIDGRQLSFDGTGGGCNGLTFSNGQKNKTSLPAAVTSSA